MKIIKLFSPGLVCLFLALAVGPVGAATLTDQLMADLLESNLPRPVYQQDNNPWPGGSYTVEVFKEGSPRVVSGEQSIYVEMPLRIVIVGNAASEFLRFRMACNASFVTTGAVKFTPGEATTLNSEITLPIPPVQATCDNMQLPVDTYLKAFVAQNKRQWELQIDRELHDWLTQPKR